MLGTDLSQQDCPKSVVSTGITCSHQVDYSRFICRICQCSNTELSSGELISPCSCNGSLKWVHQTCLQNWIRASKRTSCELCLHPFSIQSKLKRPYEWKTLPMSASEKRRFFCSAIFHSIALSCVIWSLYVLIGRTVLELHEQEMEWQFWIKIGVEAIGCLGAAILVYVWGKSYLSIIHSWINFNRTFWIKNSTPETPTNTTTTNSIPTDLNNKSSESSKVPLLLPPVLYSAPNSSASIENDT